MPVPARTIIEHGAGAFTVVISRPEGDDWSTELVSFDGRGGFACERFALSLTSVRARVDHARAVRLARETQG